MSVLLQAFKYSSFKRTGEKKDTVNGHFTALFLKGAFTVFLCVGMLKTIFVEYYYYYCWLV